MSILRAIASAIGRALAQFLAFWAYGDAKKKQGAAEASAEVFKQELTETVSRLRKGTEAATAARDQIITGVSPDEIVRLNNAMWDDGKPKLKGRGFRP